MTAYIKDAVDAGLRKGMTNAEIIAANPRLKASSIKRIANMRRKARGIARDANASGQPIHLPHPIQEALKREAIARDKGANACTLAIQLLSIIVEDGLFNAVLGEPA